MYRGLARSGRARKHRTKPSAGGKAGSPVIRSDRKRWSVIRSALARARPRAARAGTASRITWRDWALGGRRRAQNRASRLESLGFLEAIGRRWIVPERRGSWPRAFEIQLMSSFDPQFTPQKLFLMGNLNTLAGPNRTPCDNNGRPHLGCFAHNLFSKTSFAEAQMFSERRPPSKAGHITRGVADRSHTPAVRSAGYWLEAAPLFALSIQQPLKSSAHFICFAS
jgi:hypothetical protein